MSRRSIRAERRARERARLVQPTKPPLRWCRSCYRCFRAEPDCGAIDERSGSCASCWHRERFASGAR